MAQRNLRKYFQALVLIAGGLGYIQLYLMMRHVHGQSTEDFFFFWKNDVSKMHPANAIASGDSGLVRRNAHLKADRSLLLNVSQLSADEVATKNHELVDAINKKKALIEKPAPAASTGGRSNDTGGKTPRCRRSVQLWCQNSGDLGYRHGVHNVQCAGMVCDVELRVDTSFDTMQTSEAVIMYHWTSWDWATMHSHKPPGQKWVFYTLESPRHTKKHVVPPQQFYNNSYDYIMTYRYDSDFRADYGQYIDGKPELPADDNRNWADNRSKLVFWMASNCKGTSWPREDFVHRLARHVKVDTYGRCGTLTCRAKTAHCDQTLVQYKFILALENSECTDYITEKFWIQALVRGIVPIVYGPPRSDYEKVAPPNSFIHIQDFNSTIELANYLKKVDADDALYNRYFEWKKQGSLKPYGTGPGIICELGDRLETDARAVASGTFRPPLQKDWKVWWNDSCKRRGEIPF